MKGILLAGGKGTRLYPLTRVASKQLQPIYNKPMVYYSLTTMMVAGIREILIITTREDQAAFQGLLSDGSQWGIQISYTVQDEPRGIAEALILGEEFVGEDSCMLMLGDNFIYGRLDFLRAAIASNKDGATVFAYQVADPTAFGVVEFDENSQAVSLEEKPQNPKSSWAVPGMYIYSPGAAQKARNLEPSARGELEITDLNRVYLEEGTLRVQPMGRGIAWLDTGTPENLLDASNFVHALETRQGLIIGSPEEAAFRMGWLSREKLAERISQMPNIMYRRCLERIL